MASLNISRLDKGLTLIEILIMIGIISIVSLSILWIGPDSYRSYLFRNERDTIVSILQKARSQAISNICKGSGCTNGKPHGVHFENNKYIIFQGSDYATRDLDQDEEIDSNYHLDFSGSTITDVVFAELSGDVLVAGDIKLSDSASGRTSDININNEGRIAWTN